MATSNQIDLSLFGETGTGSFLGSTNGYFTLTKANNTSVGLTGTTFTLNGRSGIITINLNNLAANAFGTWTWNNSIITTNSLMFFSAIYSGNAFRDFRICAVPTSAGTATLRIYNYNGSAAISTYSFMYLIF